MSSTNISPSDFTEVAEAVELDENSSNEVALEEVPSEKKDKFSWVKTQLAALKRFYRKVIAISRLIHFRQIRGKSLPEPSSEVHVCLNCNTTFTGNHCNNCGQHFQTQRYTRHTLAKNILGGITNIDTGFPLTLKELITRPGYMISDYLAGKRVRYFRPFSTLFVLAALYMLLTQFIAPDALKDTPDEGSEQAKTEVVNEVAQVKEKNNFDTSILDGFLHSKPVQLIITNVGNWAKDNKAAGILAVLPFLAFSTKIAFRKRKYNRHYNYSEFLYAQAYISCQLLFVGLIYLLITWKSDMNSTFAVPLWLVFLLSVYTYKQLFRDTWIKTTKRTMMTYIYTGVFMVIIAIGVIMFLVIIAFLLHLSTGNG